MARLTLDTGVLVGVFRQQIELPIGDDVAVPAVVLAEFRSGILLDEDPRRAEAQRGFLDRVLSAAAVVGYGTDVVPHHAELLAHVRRIGRPRGQHDLIIAATARANGRTLVTTDKRARFDGLPGVDVRVVA